MMMVMIVQLSWIHRCGSATGLRCSWWCCSLDSSCSLEVCCIWPALCFLFSLLSMWRIRTALEIRREMLRYQRLGWFYTWRYSYFFITFTPSFCSFALLSSIFFVSLHAVNIPLLKITVFLSIFCYQTDSLSILNDFFGIFLCSLVSVNLKKKLFVILQFYPYFLTHICIWY